MRMKKTDHSWDRSGEEHINEDEEDRPFMDRSEEEHINEDEDHLMTGAHQCRRRQTMTGHEKARVERSTKKKKKWKKKTDQREDRRGQEHTSEEQDKQ